MGFEPGSIEVKGEENTTMQTWTLLKGRGVPQRGLSVIVTFVEQTVGAGLWSIEPYRLKAFEMLHVAGWEDVW